jgi:predicted enzyme involved in methoxymalonyl-ACP biosynthesis
MLKNDGIGLTVRLKDRYGDYGLICVLLATPMTPETIEVDTFLVSCRAMNRTVEHFMFNNFINVVREKGYERVVGSYIPTAKNQPVAELYPSIGFSMINDSDGASERYSLDIAAYAPLTTRVAPVDTVA